VGQYGGGSTLGKGSEKKIQGKRKSLKQENSDKTANLQGMTRCAAGKGRGWEEKPCRGRSLKLDIGRREGNMAISGEGIESIVRGRVSVAA